MSRWGRQKQFRLQGFARWVANDTHPVLEPKKGFSLTFREGLVDGLARALGRPMQPAGSWLERNPVGAWVGRSHNTIMLQGELFGLKVERGKAGWRLVALPWGRCLACGTGFHHFYFCFSKFTFFFIGRPQRCIYWRKCGFSLSGACLSTNTLIYS